jgi:hypothetical protein
VISGFLTSARCVFEEERKREKERKRERDRHASWLTAYTHPVCITGRSEWRIREERERKREREREREREKRKGKRMREGGAELPSRFDLYVNRQTAVAADVGKCAALVLFHPPGKQSSKYRV